MKNLTKQQKIFIEEYIKSLNGAVSAQKAGYKSDDYKATSEKILSNNFVIKEIKSQLKKQIFSLRVHKGYVVQKLLEIAEFSLEEEEILDKDGGFTGKRKLRDATVGLKALEYLSKYLGFNQKDADENTPEMRIITINNLDEDKI